MTTDMTTVADMTTMTDDEILTQIKKETSEHRGPFH